MAILFARQEIYTRNSTVAGYELLYRQSDREQSKLVNGDSIEGDNATSSVIANLFTNTNMDVVLQNVPAFINFTRNNLLQKVPLMLPKEKIVIEVLEDVYIDEQLIKILKLFSKKGYRLALDDFEYNERIVPLIPIVDIIKIDVLNCTANDIRRQLDSLQGVKGKLLAEKIESETQFNLCKSLGFELFQGYYLNYPDCVEGEELSENKTFLLRVMAELHNPEVRLEEVEAIILQIPKLSFRILRLANSVVYYVGRKIDTLFAAIQQLGVFLIRDWVSLILVSSIDDVSPDMLERSLIRARMCQVLARRSGIANPHHAYTVGILSNLDSILRQPLQELLQQVPLSEELSEALTHHSGNLGYVLFCAKQYELARFTDLDFSHFSESDYSQAYVEGLNYANEVMNIIMID